MTTTGAAGPSTTTKEAVCRWCGAEIFQRPSGEWDMVYVQQSNTALCWGQVETTGRHGDHEPS